MKINRIAALACSILIMALLSVTFAQGKKVTFTGYLLDQMCGGSVKDVAKAAEHTKECALMDHCAAAGYGIFAEGKFIKFDAEGSKKAKTLFEKSNKEKDIQVIADGTLNGDVLTVTTIREKGAKQK
jgi:hypothetical protein